MIEHNIKYQSIFKRIVKPTTKTIKISNEAHKTLIEIGGKSETFSDIIMRITESYKKKK